jgi:hypothetical protein
MKPTPEEICVQRILSRAQPKENVSHFQRCEPLNEANAFQSQYYQLCALFDAMKQT